MDPVLLKSSLKALADDLELSAVHVGMLGSGAVATAVADFLAAHKPSCVIVDPILKASSGANLIDKDGFKVLKQRILPLATAITPNVDEAAFLSGMAVTNLSQMRACARFLHSSGVKAAVITGGHLKNAADLLSVSSKGKVRQNVFPARHINSRSTHGTGCAFATALACQLALGRELPQAVLAAKSYVRKAIAQAYPVGRGVGPINHFATFRARR
jgi:hydroxymethylpyrimidine/phosphomethylpyrimidine kinase